MDVAIVKYNAGNVYSVVNAFRRLGVNPMLTDNAEDITKADRVVFPGQGKRVLQWHILKNIIWTNLYCHCNNLYWEFV